MGAPRFAAQGNRAFRLICGLAHMLEKRALRVRTDARRSSRRQLPIWQKIGMSEAMEELFGDPAYKGFVLQDKKRLPARFFARISGALTSRLRRLI